MRWLSFAVLAYFVLACHVGLAGFLNVGTAAPNLVLPAVVFVAINAHREHALSGAFILGVLQDLLSPQRPLGLYAMAYGLVALFIVGVRPGLYRDHPLTHLFTTLAGGIFTAGVIVLNEWVLYRLGQGPPPGILPALTGAVYTGLLAPALLWPLVRVKRLFAFRKNWGSSQVSWSDRWAILR